MIDFRLEYDKTNGYRMQVWKEDECKKDIESPFTIDSIQKRVATFSQPKPSQYDMKTLEKVDLPYFNKMFYNLIWRNHSIPTFDELVDEYVKKHFIDNDIYEYVYKSEVERYFTRKDNSIKYHYWDIRGRMQRAYSSLIRDFHYHYLITNNSWFNNNTAIKYSMKEDEYGTDATVVYGDYEFTIDLFVDTQRAREWRQEKRERHPDKDWRFAIEIPLKLPRGSNKVDLYGRWHVQCAYNGIEKVMKEIIGDKFIEAPEGAF